ncbi:MAG: hypothetical protein ACM3ZC_11270 [Bacteroidota bacterium]
MSDESDRERIWELQQRIKNLAGSMPLSSPPILALAAELDQIVNRLMGIRGAKPDKQDSTRQAGSEGTAGR